MASEQYGFVFAISYILIFSMLVSTIPAGLNGEGTTPESIGNISPSLTGDFTDHVNWTKAAYVGTPIAIYDYDLNDLHWSALYAVTGYFYIGAKDYVGGLFWLGGYWYCDFQSKDGMNRGTSLTFANIQNDADDGTAKYSMLFHANGKSAGTFLVGWNITAYENVTDAWTAGEVAFVHGVGFENSATNNLGALLVGLLTLSIPNVPTMIAVPLILPLWASVVYVLWFIVKSMIPFLS